MRPPGDGRPQRLGQYLVFVSFVRKEFLLYSFFPQPLRFRVLSWGPLPVCTPLPLRTGNEALGNSKSPLRFSFSSRSVLAQTRHPPPRGCRMGGLEARGSRRWVARRCIVLTQSRSSGGQASWHLRLPMFTQHWPIRHVTKRVFVDRPRASEAFPTLCPSARARGAM